jgi:hypothetical protein
MFNYFYNYFYKEYNLDEHNYNDCKYNDCTLKYQKTLVNKEILLNNIILKPVKKITTEEYNFIMNIKKYNPKYNPNSKNKEVTIGISNIIEGYLNV